VLDFKYKNYFIWPQCIALREIKARPCKTLAKIIHKVIHRYVDGLEKDLINRDLARDVKFDFNLRLMRPGKTSAFLG
jgi:hypothetical protein